MVGPSLARFIFNNNNNNNNNKNNNNNILKNQKKVKDHFKIFVIFSHIFPTILHNIGLYIYIIRYRSGIKIPGFL